MPPLREALPRHQVALVRFANWMTTEAVRRGLSFSLQGPDAPDFSAVFTPGSSNAMYLEDAKEGSLFALVFRPEGVRFFGSSVAGSTGLDFRRARIQPNAFLHLITVPRTRNPEHHANITFGVGGVRDTGESYDSISVVVSPIIACEFLVRNAVPSFDLGVVGFSAPVGELTVSFRFYEDTGELIELQAVPLTSASTTVGPAPPRLSLWVGDGKYKQIIQRIDQAWGMLPFDPAQRRSLADVMLHTDLWKQTGDTPKVQALMRWGAIAIRLAERLLATPELRAWLDSGPALNEPIFRIPTDPQHPEQHNGIEVQGGLMLYKFSRKFSPPQSWPARLACELPYLIEGQTARSNATFDHLINDKDMGPIGSLLSAKLLQIFNSPQAWQFARRTVEHGSLEEFRMDCHTLFESDSTVAHLLRAVLPAIASMTDQEVDQVATSLSAADALVWRQCVAILKNTKAEGIAAALRPQLESWWDREMCPQLANRIDDFLSKDGPFDPATVAATVNGRAISRKLLEAVRRNPQLLDPLPPGPLLTAPPANGDSALETLVVFTLALEEARLVGTDISRAIPWGSTRLCGHAAALRPEAGRLSRDNPPELRLCRAGPGSRDSLHPDAVHGLYRTNRSGGSLDG
ncbi:MAG: hypothetical protein HYV75_08275 [Opitutae bacterium]|nr:hypothetical protein [Opitutae bacterium]